MYTIDKNATYNYLLDTLIGCLVCVLLAVFCLFQYRQTFVSSPHELLWSGQTADYIYGVSGVQLLYSVISRRPHDWPNLNECYKYLAAQRASCIKDLLLEEQRIKTSDEWITSKGWGRNRRNSFLQGIKVYTQSKTPTSLGVRRRRTLN